MTLSSLVFCFFFFFSIRALKHHCTLPAQAQTALCVFVSFLLELAEVLGGCVCVGVGWGVMCVCVSDRKPSTESD